MQPEYVGRLRRFVPKLTGRGRDLFAAGEEHRVLRGQLGAGRIGRPARMHMLIAPIDPDFKQDVIVGASLQVSVPIGQYDDSRLVNIGTNRWSFKPELGVSKALGRWTVELSAAAKLYTDNDDFYGGQRRSQDPDFSTQGHVIYSFHSGVWASVDATYFMGGRTAINGVRNDDRLQNWRVGGTLAFPVDRLNSIKLYASSRVSARTGNNYDLIGIAWQHRWGGGL